MLCKDYLLVLGTPGSGKTTVIVKMLEILSKMGKKVLLTSYTHTALDNILVRLAKTTTKFIRIASNSSLVDESVKPYIRERFKSIKEVNEAIENIHIYASTCIGIKGNNILQCIKFDYCIIDEASQISEPICIGPVLMAEKTVMIGDYFQLNPLVKSNVAKNKGLGKSLFQRLCEIKGQNALVMFDMQVFSYI